MIKAGVLPLGGTTSSTRRAPWASVAYTNNFLFLK